MRLGLIGHARDGHARRRDTRAARETAFGGRGAAGVPADDMDIVGAFIKGLPGRRVTSCPPCTCITMEPSSTYTNACALCRWTGSDPPGAYSTVISNPSFPENSLSSWDMSDVTLAS